MFMKSRTFSRTEALVAPATLTLLAAALPAGAQVKLPPLQIEEAEKQGYFVRIGPRIQFNIEASVSLTPQTPQQPGNYDNGFVLPDVSGTASGLTWNWGYADAAQVSGDAINFERYSNLPHAGVFDGESDDSVYGGEVIFGVAFGRFDIGRKEATWGGEIGYALTPFEIRNSSTVAGTVDYYAATHGLGGIVPPAAPYQGTFDGPGPLIDLNPSATTAVSSAATSTFDGTLKSDLHWMRVGLWLELPLTESIAVSVSAGYASVLADTTFDFSESISIANGTIPGISDTAVSAYASEWQSGFYGQLKGSWQFSKHFGLYLAADYQHLSGFRFTEAGREVSLKFEGTYGASGGLIFSW